jgi:cytochrome c-type biogenesis protein CcmH/NrfG
MPTAQQAKLWSNSQAGAVALVCVAAGVALGYLLHSLQPAPKNLPQPPGMAGSINAGMPTLDRLKRMGDAQAQPLLAELQKNPNDAGLLAKLGSIYFRTRQFSLSADYYGRAAQVKPDAETFVSLSNAYHYAGADERALDALNRALAIDPKCPDALFNLGMLRWQVKGDPKGAVDAWQRLLKTNPDHPRRAQVEAMIARARQHMNVPARAPTGKPESE